MQQPLASGFVRIAVRVPGGQTPTPGELVQVLQSGGIGLDQVGPVWVEGSVAQIDIRSESGRVARTVLDQVGETRIAEMRWQWLKLLIGRNNGFTMNRLRTLMVDCTAGPLGRIHLNNTHTVVGIQEERATAVVAVLATTKINGKPVRHELMPVGTGPGDPTFTPGAPRERRDDPR